MSHSKHCRIKVTGKHILFPTKSFHITEFSVIVVLLDDRFDNRPVRESPHKTFPRAQRAVRPAKMVKIRITIPHISLFSF